MHSHPALPFRLFWAFALLPLTLTGCELFGTAEEEEDRVTGVYVANQGDFGSGNGSVTVYDPLTETTATLAEDLGSILQSINLHDERLYVMANTADRVYRYNLTNPEAPVASVPVLSPRYMAFVGEEKAYVTSLYGAPDAFSGGKVNVLDLTTFEVQQEVAVGDNPEGIAVAGGRAYVANSGFGAGRTVTVLDTETDEVIETIDVACDGPRFLSVDAQDEVFVLCTGRTIYDPDFNVIGETDGAVRILNGATGQIVKTIEIDGRISTSGPGQDAYYVPGTEELYVVKNADTILRFNTATNTLAGEIGPLQGAPIGAVAYDPVRARLYLGRAPSFTESGQVTIHERDGTPIGSFTAGIAPTYVALPEDP